VTPNHRWLVAVAMAIAAVTVPPASAGAQPIVVGVYAPTAPFPNTAARLDFASGLAEHIATTIGADSGVGRVYAKASDFASAARRGAIDYAVVDATYLAGSRRRYSVLGVATREGSATGSWQLVAGDKFRGILDLRNKRVIVPSMGGREQAFAINVALDSEVPGDFFGNVQSAPDAVSAVASVSLGRADAAMVPVSVSLPNGLSKIVTLPGISWPVLVVIKSSPRDGQVAAAAKTFSGGGFTGFADADESVYRTLARRFRTEPRRGPMIAPLLRGVLRGFIKKQDGSIRRPALSGYILQPN